MKSQQEPKKLSPKREISFELLIEGQIGKLPLE